MNPLPTKIVVESYIGYRIWEVTPDGRLFSVVTDFEWSIRQPAESDPLVESGVLNEGIHAWTTARDAWRAFDQLADEAPHLYLVVGSVALWGDVTFEPDMMRATRAYPLSFFETWDPECNGYIERAGKMYGVDVISCPILAYDVA